MAAKYTLEEVKKLVFNGKVNPSNLDDILLSLGEYNYNEDIKTIFYVLSENENLPLETRETLKEAAVSVESFEAVVEEAEQQASDVELIGAEDEVIETEESYVNVPRVPIAASSGDDEISLDNDAVLGGVVAYATAKGVMVASKDPGVINYPEISFKLDEKSKPYLDNILTSLYDNKDGIDVAMTRVEATGEELLTLKIEDPTLSQRQLQAKGKSMFAKVDELLKTTDEEKDYEKEMPQKLRELKDRFHNDDPKIPNANFTIGYSNSNGQKKYYMVANNKETAIELAEEMGYAVTKEHGGNVFELDTDGVVNMKNTKLESVSKPVDYADAFKGTENGQGISDLDIDYNNRNYSNGNAKKIEDFISDNKGSDNLAVIQITATSDTQRIVKLASSDGTNEELVFNDGKDFDNYTLPKLAEKFASNSNVDKGINPIVQGEGGASYEASSGNTYFRMVNYDTGIVHQVNNTIDEYSVKTDVKYDDNSKTNSYQYSKRLGTYPTNREAAKTSFLPIIAFLLVLIIGFIVIYLIIGG